MHIDDQSTTPTRLFTRLTELHFFPEGTTEYEMVILNIILNKLYVYFYLLVTLYWA